MTTVKIDRELVAKVWRELDELKKLGIAVPRHAYVVAGSEATAFFEGGMSITAISDLCISLG
jgi:hypothetical protein